MDNKVIVLDFGIFLHRSIFATVRNPSASSTYICLSSIIGCLKKIGVNKEDKVIVACDFLKSWRKKYAPEYKADRAKKRKESPIDWKKEYEGMNWLLDKLDEATNWNIIKLPHLEADDIMASASRYYQGKEIILVTYDSDMEQLWEYNNIKIFSPMTKRYKIPPTNYNSSSAILKKVNKEVSDNLINPILCEEDFNNRLKCVNLLQLPIEIESQIKAELDNLDTKQELLEKLPFDSLRERFPQIYNEGTESYEKSVKYYDRKKKVLANKKAIKRGKTIKGGKNEIS